MKLSILAILASVVSVVAFAPAANVKTSHVVRHAEPVEQSRKAFLSVAAISVFGAAIAPAAFAMDQENIADPTEQWETGSPTPAAAAARVARYTNARTQLTSNYPPIKRLTLERKSPVTRLDINAPNFEAYRKTYPGLFGAPKN
jgi:hypothetical protein